MLLLVDAYNLLHQSDALHRVRGEGWLAKARERLLDRLAELLGTDLASQTCLVFDSRAAPSHLPATTVHRAIEVRFAVDHDEADDLLEEMIARHPTPKRLMVVSSDHRVQRAAKRRGARFADSDHWYAMLVEHGPQLAIPWPPAAPVKPVPSEASLLTEAQPTPPSDEAELAAWLDAFTDSRIEPQPTRRKVSRTESPRPATASPTKPPANLPAKPTKKSRSERPSPSDKPDPDRTIDADLVNPFPEGYGEDLLE